MNLKLIIIFEYSYLVEIGTKKLKVHHSVEQMSSKIYLINSELANFKYIEILLRQKSF
jgi:hypothetical protein